MQYLRPMDVTMRKIPGSRFIVALLLLTAIQSCRTSDVAETPEPEAEDPRVETIRRAVNHMLEDIYDQEQPVELPPAVNIDHIELDDENMILDIHMNERFSYVPLRPENTGEIYRMLMDHLPRRFRDYNVTLYSLEEPIRNLIPNYYRRSAEEYDRQRLPYTDKLRPRPIVQRNDRHVVPEAGLHGRQIALWHSHGWYFNKQKQRWEWQRPRLFQTVEDQLPMSFTIPYLIPMLENAGAYVWVPRERDMQSNEAIVDFDGSTGDSRITFHTAEGEYTEDSDTVVAADSIWRKGEPGFAIGSPPYSEGENPFRQGSYRYLTSSKEGDSSIRWIPDIPETGEYAVYVSYASLGRSADDAYYSVYHRGGKTSFTVNQTIGGGTWVYLGHFEFEQGVNPEQGRVELANYSWRPSIVTADAVRFGGGMGNIEREGNTGGRPRYLEAARYYMQFAGMPDSLVYGLSDDESDAVDDYQGRGEWVNYLKGAPYGPNEDRSTTGLGIPIDLSLAFHTDAGITRNDTVVGTLMIYSIEDVDSLRTFPDLVSRLANRDFADIMQTEIVNDIRSEWDPEWVRRHLFNRMYSEAARPNVPAALLELLSHQNFLDMQFALDPRFRFDMSRSIYKSMLKFISNRYQTDYVVQPLPVSHFRALPQGGRDIQLRWKPVTDSLEPTADPDHYIVYKKRGEEPFDAGRLTDQLKFVFRDLDPGVMYEFKVVAVNEGGKSFPSETLAVSVSEEPRRPILIINGFERISGPAVVDEPEFKGFANFLDSGVPDRYDINYTGDQFDYDPDSEWRTNDAPGHGASHADFETRVVPGNRFDFPAVYGEALMELEIPFVSASAASVRNRQVDMTEYDAVVLILGKQKTTRSPKHDRLDREPEFKVFPQRMREEIERYLQLGGRMFISGAHVGTDAEIHQSEDPEGMTFIRQKLRFANETNHAARTGGVRVVSDSLLTTGYQFTFNTGYHPEIYRVDAPDAIVPYEEPEENQQAVREEEQNEKNDGMVRDNEGEKRESGRKVSDGILYRDKPRFPVMPSARSELIPSGPETLIRYEENRFSAGIGYRSEHNAVVTFGFPFETIIDPEHRLEVLSGVLRYLGIDH